MVERIPVAKLGDIPDGEAIVVPRSLTGTIDDIALFQDGGEYFALDNTCSHELASLSEGWIENGAVECHCIRGSSACGTARCSLRPPTRMSRRTRSRSMAMTS